MGNSHFVLGIDLGGTKMALATADMNGTLLRMEKAPTDANAGEEQAIARAGNRYAPC